MNNTRSHITSVYRVHSARQVRVAAFAFECLRSRRDPVVHCTVLYEQKRIGRSRTERAEHNCTYRYSNKSFFPLAAMHYSIVEYCTLRTLRTSVRTCPALARVHCTITGLECTTGIRRTTTTSVVYTKSDKRAVEQRAAKLLVTSGAQLTVDWAAEADGGI